MSGKSSVKLNFIYNTIYQLLLIVLPLITSPYVSRTLGSEGLGVYSYTYSVATCFASVGMLGILNYGNRTIASIQNDRTKRSIVFWNILSLQVIATVIVLIGYIFYLIFLCPNEYKSVFYVQIMVVLCSFCDVNWYFFGVEKFKLTVTRNLIIKTATTILIFLLVHTKSDTIIYTFIIGGSLLLSNLAVWPFLKNEVDFVRPTIKEIKPHIGQAIILFIPVVAVILYNRMDKVMLGFLSTMSETGFYDNTEKIVNIPKGLITALGTVMLPRMSFLYANGENKSADKYINKSMEFVCLMASALTFGVAGIAPEFAPWFFGEEFRSVGLLIMAISPTIFFISWANVIRTQYLIPLRYDGIYVISVWIGAVVNLIINAILIPAYGALGAVVGTVFAEGAVMIYQTIRVRKNLPVSTYIKNGIYYVFAGVIMFCVVRFVGLNGNSGSRTLFFEVVCGAVTFILICTPYILKKHREEVQDFMKKLKGIVRHGK